MHVTDTSYRKILGLNQQTYQRLKLALGLGLRRQLFIAVCDDLPLRDRLAVQLEAELMSLAIASPASVGQEGTDSVSLLRRYPRLVTLHLNLHDPNPLTQMARWLSQFPPPQMNGQHLPFPAFQVLGIEQLTRQPATVQRLFFTHLQGIERSLSMLESSLLFWMPLPWFRALSQSAPEFWRSRTGIFEFVGDPTPSSDAVNGNTKLQMQVSLAAQLGSEFETAATPEEATDAATPPDDDWSNLFNDLDQLDEVGTTPASKSGQADPSAQPAARSTPPQEVNLADRSPSEASHPVPPVEQPSTPSDLHDRAIAELESAFNLAKSGFQHAPLLQQIELLHQQQAPPGVLANAYRMLGNLYRDRIEQGDNSPQNLTVAIEAYEQALLWLDETSPLWVDVLNDLGNLYWIMARGATAADQALSSLQQATQYYQLAITRINLQTQPHVLSMVQNNLGATYADLARYENPAENLQRSVQSYEQALRYRKADDEPLRYASTQNNLGTTYWNLAQHQQPVLYLKQAIAAYSEALRYYNPEQEALNYAMIQNNLGTAYWNLAQHERPRDWLMLALGAYRMALRYRTAEAAPAAFAATQNNLGTAYWHLANHSRENPAERLDYLQQAIAAYEAAIHTATQLHRAQTGSGAFQTPLGFDLYATYNNLGLAHYQIAIDVQSTLTTTEQTTHLEAALKHHVHALEGWQQRPDFRQTALNCIVQVIRAFYTQCGIAGQSQALSNIPASLLPEILPQL